MGDGKNKMGNFWRLGVMVLRDHSPAEFVAAAGENPSSGRLPPPPPRCGEELFDVIEQFGLEAA